MEKCTISLTIPSLEQVSFKCKMCDFVTTAKTHLIAHEKSHRTCEMCGKDFVGMLSSRDYKRHMKKHDQTKTFYECLSCKKIFDRKFNYTRHIKSKKCSQ